jgi:KEOPS complex subunit Pcc1
MPTSRIDLPRTYEESEILVSIDFPSSRIARTVFSSVAPETQQTLGYRSLTKLDANGRVLTMRIQAQDLVALRAASNSFLRFVAASFRAIEVVAPFYRTRQVPDRPAQKLERRS